MARLQEHYKNVVVPELMKTFEYPNTMMVPKIIKITLNIGIGEAIGDRKVVEHATGDLQKICGQKPIVNLARKSVANFKVREDWPIGTKVTLRRNRMYEMLDRMISVAIPRIRDFRGLSQRSFDGRGNYSFGVKEQIIFPEIDYDKIDALRGMDITITTTAATDKEAEVLLRGFGFPLRT